MNRPKLPDAPDLRSIISLVSEIVHAEKIRHDGFPYQSKVSRVLKAKKAECGKP